MKAIAQKNDDLQNKFFAYLDAPKKDPEKKKELKTLCKEMHNKQWTGDQIHNILTKESNCLNDCTYCYMKRLKSKFFNVDIENLVMIVDQKKVKKLWKSKRQRYIMFPSSHDIFPDYVADYARACINILKNGHNLLIVTKPRIECVKFLVDHLDKYKNKIVFRFTITSNNQNVLNYWEKNAPTYFERLTSLKCAFDNGYTTSVSIEPYLEDPSSLIKDIEPYTNEKIWIGKMSGINTMKLTDEWKDKITKLYDRKNMVSMVQKLRSNKKILWKTSIMKEIINSVC